MVKQILLATLFVFSFSSNAMANAIPSPQKMIELIKEEAKKGNPAALFELGQSYRFGNVVPVDYSKAVKYLSKASELGHSDAQNSFGLMYQNGDGVEQSFQLAKKWLTESAQQGNAYAMLNLGHLYTNGQGVSRDFRKACDYYFKAAVKGKLAKAESNVGICHMNGEFDGKKDYQAARLWLDKAATKGDSYAIKIMRERGWR